MTQTGGGDSVSSTLGAVVVTTLGAGAGVLGGTTLGEMVGFGEGEGDGSILGAGVGGGGAERGDEYSFHLLKSAQRLSTAMSWVLMESSVALLMAVEGKLIAWRSLSS